jgi:hypothetical protein
MSDRRLKAAGLKRYIKSRAIVVQSLKESYGFIK